MASFVTSVELYGTPSEEVYKNLHIAMKEKGFSRSFMDNGSRYDLPHSMYLLAGGISATQTVAIAKEAADTVWKDFSVHVTETVVRMEYYNLRLTKPY